MAPLRRRYAEGAALGDRLAEQLLERRVNAGVGHTARGQQQLHGVSGLVVVEGRD
jgi:hypothetical protein